MRSWIFSLIAFVALPSVSFAQPFNVRAWYAAGQVFVVWQQPGPPAPPWDTVSIYASPGVQASTTNMTLVGQLFFPEYTGARLDRVMAGARIRVPAAGGGTYLLGVDEGVFVYTPHQAGNLFFAAVYTPNTVVVASNSAATAFGYDPVNEPVEAHWQFDTQTQQQFPCSVYVVWIDGAADENSGRPDFPIMGNANRVGIPHVFCITKPHPPDMLPGSPYPCVVALHGGGGEYEKFRPGEPDRASLTLGLTDGIVVTPDDNEYYRDEASLVNVVTRWFGYAKGFNPFDGTVRTNPPPGEVIVNYTSRRVFWILDWLQRLGSGYTIDPQKVAVLGHSAGSWGATHISREEPGRFCAAVCYSLPMGFVDNPGANPLQGQVSANLPTNILSPLTGMPLGNIDVLSPWVRLSATQRDFCFTRIYLGKRDETGEATWTDLQRTAMDTINTAAVGIIISWDEREHGVEFWRTDEPDAPVPPALCTPWPDIGQWVHPVKTLRPAAQTLVDNYRFDQSYPGFFNTDEDIITPDRQPDPGPGDPCALGWSEWGSWGGCLDWDSATLTDTTSQWACTMFLVDNAAATVDDSLVAQLQADLSIRRPQSFAPPAGTSLFWTLSDSATDLVMQSGTTSVAADGLVTVAGLLIPQDPVRARLTFNFCPGRKGDFTNDNAVTSADISTFVTILLNGPADATELCKADMNSDSAADGRDVKSFVRCLVDGQCP